MTKPTEFYDFLTRIVGNRIAEIQEDIDGAELAAGVKAARQSALARWMRAWTKTSRRVGLGAILDAEGLPAALPTHSTRILREHWAPVFSAKPFGVFACQPFRAYVQRVGPECDGIEWEV
eukprot:3564480-Alexandrium_andersonii.AAC.1